MIPMTMAPIRTAAVTIGTSSWRVQHLHYGTDPIFSCHFIHILPLHFSSLSLPLSVCLPASLCLVDLQVAAMSPNTSAPGGMETDDLIPNEDHISTKVIEETFDIKPQLPDESISLATTPYLGLIGFGHAYLQPDLDLLTMLLARVCLKAPMLTEAQLSSPSVIRLVCLLLNGLLR